MASVKVVENVNAGADSVWDLFRDFGGITRFSAGIDGCTVEGEGVGAVRTITMGGGLKLQERLEAFDDAGRSLSYAIIGDHPLPFDNYLSTVKVIEQGDGCSVEWSSTYDPKGTEDQASGLIQGIYRGGIAGIKKTLGA
ncbi:MAG: SRPBCC family protein [Myxococcota bacterium]